MALDIVMAGERNGDDAGTERFGRLEIGSIQRPVGTLTLYFYVRNGNDTMRPTSNSINTCDKSREDLASH